MAIDIVLKMLSQGVDKVQTDVQKVKDTVKGVGDETKTTTAETGRLTDSLADVGETGNKLENVVTTIRNVGAGLALAGAAGLALANRFTQAAIEADGLGSKTEALLSGQGLEGAIDQVKELGLQLALATGLDDDELSAKIAEAVASGRVMSLRQYGIVIDAVGQKSITAARNVSAQAGAQEALNQIMKASIPAIQTLRDTSSAAALAAGELDVRWGNIEETIGEGTGVIKAALYNNVLSPLLDIAEANPEVLKTGGAVFAIGSAAAGGIGSLIGMVSQIGLMIISLNTMGITSVASFGAMSASALAAAGSIAIILAEIALVAVAVAGLMYAFDKIAHYKEDKALKENIAKGDATDQKRLDFANERRAKKGLAPLTMAEYEGDPTADDKKNVDLGSAANQLTNIANGTAAPVAPALPAAPPIPSFNSVSAVATALPAQSGEAWIDTSKIPESSGGTQPKKITLKPKTRVSQNSGGDYVVEILPEKFVIPNDFGRAVGAL